MPYSPDTKRILCNTTEDGLRLEPEEYMESYKEQSRQKVVLGIRIENHSNLKLTKLSHHPSKYNGMISDITNVDPFSESLFVIDNMNFIPRGVLGSTSWKVTLGDEDLRLVLTYFVKYL